MRFVHEALLIFADLSIDKQSKSANGNPLKYYSIQDSDLFACLEKYEIEMELDNTKMSSGTEYDAPEIVKN